MVPIIIISFNNYRYVDNTIKQLLQVDPTLASFLIIMDNASQDPATKEYLKNTIVRVIFKIMVHGYLRPKMCMYLMKCQKSLL